MRKTIIAAAAASMFSVSALAADAHEPMFGLIGAKADCSDVTGKNVGNLVPDPKGVDADGNWKDDVGRGCMFIPVAEVDYGNMEDPVQG